jgi:pimeloyl-ACP methyl ester carboxylesterase
MRLVMAGGAAMEIVTLPISGYRGEDVPNHFFRQEGEADHLAIVLPGLGYSADMPLLFFTVSHLVDLGAEILQVEYPYSQCADYRTLDADERQRWLIADTVAACRVALGQRRYRRITLVGKSLGTRAMAHLLAHDETFADATTIWFTPVWHESPVRDAILATRQRALVVIGTADPHYDTTLAAATRAALNGELMIVAEADHGMEIEGDMLRSIAVLDEAMRAVVRVLAVR